MLPNLLVVALAALVPMIIGFIYYHPKLAGTAWMNAAGMTEEKVKGGNMPVILIVSYILSFLLSFLSSSLWCIKLPYSPCLSLSQAF